jgi:hypothetical protein
LDLAAVVAVLKTVVVLPLVVVGELVHMHLVTYLLQQLGLADQLLLMRLAQAVQIRVVLVVLADHVRLTLLLFAVVGLVEAVA